jgi:hypothetical protein
LDTPWLRTQVAYACALASGVAAADGGAPVWAEVVVGPAARLGTVGDLDPREHPVTATAHTAAAAGHSFSERSLGADSLDVML